MIDVRRLLAVGAGLVAAVALTCTHVWGDPKRDKDPNDLRGNGPVQPPDKKEKERAPLDGRFSEDLARSRFADQPLLIYATAAGETLFALQVQPKLDAPAPRPRDVVVLIDTSASKFGLLALSRQILEALAGKLGPDDRVSVWTVNTRPKNISGGFKAPKGLAEVSI